MVYLLLVHWIADFVLQTNEQATTKSSSIEALCKHTVTYSAVWVMALALIGGGWMSVVFGLITFITHTTQDYFTSRWVKHYFDKRNYHNGFVVIGLDQILHYIQIVVTLLLLFP
jgi:hypothetical protein